MYRNVLSVSESTVLQKSPNAITTELVHMFVVIATVLYETMREGKNQLSNCKVVLWRKQSQFVKC